MMNLMNSNNFKKLMLYGIGFTLLFPDEIPPFWRWTPTFSRNGTQRRAPSDAYFEVCGLALASRSCGCESRPTEPSARLEDLPVSWNFDFMIFRYLHFSDFPLPSLIAKNIWKHQPDNTSSS